VKAGITALAWTNQPKEPYNVQILAPQTESARSKVAERILSRLLIWILHGYLSAKSG
jgi:hypothetical protein